MKTDYETQQQYLKIREDHEREQKRRTDELREHIKEYDDLCFKRSELYAQAMKAGFDGNIEHKTELLEQVAGLDFRETEILREQKLPADWLSLHYSCSKCRDRGYLPDGSRCVCLDKMIREASVANYTMQGPESVFSDYDLSLFSDTPSKNGISHRDRAKKRCDLFEKFCTSYEQYCAGGSIKCENYLFFGKPGTGKTFLSSCIANRLSEAEVPFIYISAPKLVELIFEDIRGSREGTSMKQLKEIPLLILDDLGTESSSEFVTKQITELISERLQHDCWNIISSNLNMNDIRKTYPERLASRLTESFIPVIFEGPDLRTIIHQKKLEGTKQHPPDQTSGK